MTSRRKFTPEFKAKVVLDMLTEGTSLAQASREYGMKDSVLSRRKQEFIDDERRSLGANPSHITEENTWNTNTTAAAQYKSVSSR